MNVWESNVYGRTPQSIEHDTPEAAIAAVEQHNKGRVVLFYVWKDGMGGTRYSSCSMWSFDIARPAGQEWQAHYIHDGHGDAVAAERPH